MKAFTVRIQERAGDMVVPVSVYVDDLDGAIRTAADRMACHGEVCRVDVYHGHNGWYADEERIWTGSLTWSQASDADCKMVPA